MCETDVCTLETVPMMIALLDDPIVPGIVSGSTTAGAQNRSTKQEHKTGAHSRSTQQEQLTA